MANVTLPKIFVEKLKDQALISIVNNVISRFGEILKKDNKLFFFPEYTDHGIDHIQDILAASANLMPFETYKILSEEDVAYYIMSVILHDIGMHITNEGFSSLLEGDFDDIRVKELDSHTWKDLWNDYLSEAKRFNGKQLNAIFGDEDAIIEVPDFSKPGKISLEHKLLVGEFIRRHHARLAHEIALKGFPGKPQILEFTSELEQKRKNIIGLIARSHGSNLRICLDYIEKIHGKSVRRVTLGVHAVYLMIILRLADYLQIDDSRTSIQLLKIKRFSSPISAKEHNAHLSIDSVDDKYQDDPERIYVSASPQDSEMHLKLKRLIKDIQSEFDVSWAVLGELYGKFEEKPEIKYRRITSNLDDEAFIVAQKYVADSFAFKANDEIMKLLIAPLYGDDPKYGVRELLQNALDACRERELLEKVKGRSFQGAIKVEIVKEPNDEIYFQIVDNGIGMDADVIKNYFLSAGASYRKSMDWQKDFIDNDGKSKVRRSGRFGVGILAAFLLGNEIYVETKKWNSGIGYSFSAELNQEQINIFKNDKIEIGTRIKIKISQKNVDEFKPIQKNTQRDYDSRGKVLWHEWFTLTNPKVSYVYLGEELVPYKKLDPDISDKMSADWSEISPKDFNKILWTYSHTYPDPKITCNGIVVKKNRISFSAKNAFSIAPKIGVFDDNAMLPLTLNRNDFSRPLPFISDLVHDIYKSFIAKILIIGDILTVDQNVLNLGSQRIDHPGVGGSIYGLWNYGIGYYNCERNYIRDYILCSKKGFILNYNYFIQKLGSINVLFLQTNNILKSSKIDLDIKDYFFAHSYQKINAIYDYRNAIEANSYNNLTKTDHGFNSRIHMKRDRYDYLFTDDYKRVPRWLKYKSKAQFDVEDWVCLSFDTPPGNIISKSFLIEHTDNINFIRAHKCDCPYPGYTELDELLEKYIGDDVVIPYDLEERRAKYPLAFKELDRYMRMYT